METTKIKVYTACQPGGSILFSPDLQTIMDTLKFELECLEVGDTWEFEFGSVMLSQKEIDELGEFDGF